MSNTNLCIKIDIYFILKHAVSIYIKTVIVKIFSENVWVPCKVLIYICYIYNIKKILIDTIGITVII